MTIKITNGEFVHLHNHSEYSSFDALNKLSQFPKYAKEMGFKALALTDHGNIGGAVKFIQNCRDKDNKGFDIKPIVGCLVKGQEIVTSKGIKSVEDIVEGDMVLTHMGRFRKVLRTNSRLHNGSFYTLKFSGLGRSITVTNEHPFLVRTIENNDTEKAYPDHSNLLKWVRADQLVAGRTSKKLGMSTYKTYVCLPKLQGNNDVVDVLSYMPERLGCIDGFIAKTEKNNKYDSLKSWDLPCQLELNEDISYLLGLFTAEGSFSRYENHSLNGGIRFSLGIHEQHLADKVTEIVDRYFGIEANIQQRPEKNGIEISFASLPIAYLFEGLCGSGAANKKVPYEILTANPVLRKAFLDGVLDGDGKQEGQRTLKVISKSLAWGVRQLLVDMGHWANVAEVKEKDRQIAYAVPYNPDRKYARTIQDSRYVYKPLISITKSEQQLEVFNFEVEEDNSYVSDCILHNCEFYLSKDRSLRGERKEGGKVIVKGQSDGRKGNRHLVLIAKNWKGWQNLCSLSQASWTEGYYIDPRIDLNLLSQHSEGLICNSACLSSIVNANLLHGRFEEAKKAVGIFKDIFKEDFHLEVMYHGIDAEGMIIPDIIKLGKDMGIPIIATNDCHYCKKEQGLSQEILMCMSTSKCLHDPKHLHFPYHEFYLKSAAEMATIFGSHPDFLFNTVMVADKVDAKDIWDNMTSGMRLPRYKIPENFSSPLDYLTYLSWEGMKKLGWDKSEPHCQSLRRELEDVRVAWDNNKYDFATYFLIVRDYIQKAKDSNILTGCGRGSGYASVLLRAIGISYGPDPLKYDLIWERFLGFDDKYFVQEQDFFGEAAKIIVEEKSSHEELFEDRDVTDDAGGVDRY